MTLIAYGCSWTEGQGADVEHENTITDKDEIIKFRKENSWVKFLSDKMGLPWINNGVSGNANNKIFNQVVSDIQNNKINKDDIVIIMWSSSLRDYVPFLPKGEWISWSIKHLIERPERFFNSYSSENKTYDNFLIEFKELFVTEMFNQNYYNIVNQNYIIFLQKLLEHYDIKYYMCDGIESMLIDLHKKDDITGSINKKLYWGFHKKTFRDFLNNTKRMDIWEYQDVTYNTRATQHPNKNGYMLIAEELYKFLN
jgi:hypothetical protein